MATPPPGLLDSTDEHLVDCDATLPAVRARYAAMSERVRPVSQVPRTAKAAEPEWPRSVRRCRPTASITCALSCSASPAGPSSACRSTAQPRSSGPLASPDVGRMLCHLQGWTTGQCEGRQPRRPLQVVEETAAGRAAGPRPRCPRPASPRPGSRAARWSARRWRPGCRAAAWPAAGSASPAGCR